MSIELLESRIAPAAVLHFTDHDGDLITISLSKGDLNATTHPAGKGVVIDELMTSLDSTGGDLVISVAQAPGGDGHVNVGEISSPVAFGIIVVPGNLEDLRVHGSLDTLQVDSSIISGTSFHLLSVDGPVNRLTIVGSLVGQVLFADSIQDFEVGGAVINSDILSNATFGAMPIVSGEIGGNVADSLLSFVNFLDLHVHGTVKNSTVNALNATIDGNVVDCRVRPYASAFTLTPTPETVPTLGDIEIGGSLLRASVTGAKVDIHGKAAQSTIDSPHIQVHHDFIDSTVLTDEIELLSIGGSFRGGFVYAGAFGGFGLPAANGHIGKVIIRGDMKPSAGKGALGFSLIQAAGATGTIDSVYVGGSIIGGKDVGSSEISATLGIGKVVVKGDVRGGSAFASGSIEAGRIGSVDIGGDLVSGRGQFSGSGFIAAERLGSVHIHGDVRGDGATNSISASGAVVGTAVLPATIGSITVDGNVINARIGAGSNFFGLPVTGDAHIGTIRVHGDWVNSHVNAGVTLTPLGQFVPLGNSSIGRIQIDGRLSDYDREPGASSFLAHQIGSFSYGTYRAPLHAGAANDFTIGFGSGKENLVIGEA